MPSSRTEAAGAGTPAEGRRDVGRLAGASIGAAGGTTPSEDRDDASEVAVAPPSRNVVPEPDTGASGTRVAALRARRRLPRWRPAFGDGDIGATQSFLSAASA